MGITVRARAKGDSPCFGDDPSAHALMPFLNGKPISGAVVVRTGRKKGYIVKIVVLESTSGSHPLTQNASWRVLTSVLDGWTLKPHDCHGLVYEVLRGNVTLKKANREALARIQKGVSIAHHCPPASGEGPKGPEGF